ncbi:hypothetical protein Y1Q_0003285 [Alligator mississippiensis]|uniref:Uncharacterized protein n=1 Tax=Alligator mississippiensis TaxID=8496 RepID=A0A151ME73_ALLMI|nr:hypothetical protein Y1Q_0003285 [Alligator mississippiensis]
MRSCTYAVELKPHFGPKHASFGQRSKRFSLTSIFSTRGQFHPHVLPEVQRDLQLLKPTTKESQRIQQNMVYVC